MDHGVTHQAFLQGNEFVAQLLGLSFDLVFEPFLTLKVALGPDAFVVLDLFGDDWPARLCTRRVPFHSTRPPLMSLSGHKPNQEAKCAAVGHLEDRSRSTSLNSARTDISRPGIWVVSTPNSL